MFVPVWDKKILLIALIHVNWLIEDEFPSNIRQTHITYDFILEFTYLRIGEYHFALVLFHFKGHELDEKVCRFPPFDLYLIFGDKEGLDIKGLHIAVLGMDLAFDTRLWLRL